MSGVVIRLSRCGCCERRFATRGGGAPQPFCGDCMDEYGGKMCRAVRRLRRDPRLAVITYMRVTKAGRRNFRRILGEAFTRSVQARLRGHQT